MKYIIAVLIILFASFADIFLYRIDIIPVPPAEFLIPLFLVLAILKYPPVKVLDIFQTHSSKFFIAVLLFAIVYSAFSMASQDVLLEEIVLSLFTILLYLFLVQFFRTESNKLTFMVVFLSFIILAGSVWYDFFIGLPKYDVKLVDLVRKGGFGENPNQAASSMKFLALGILVFLHRLKTKRLLIIVLMVVTVFLTMSRSGIVSVILILIFGAVNNWDTKFKVNPSKLFTSFFKLAFLFAGLYVGLVFFAGVIKENFPAFTRGAAGERLDLLIGESDQNFTSEDVQFGGRGALLIKYWNDFKDKPMGHGTGYSSDKKFNSLSTHNYYLYLAVNFGVLALILYLLYIVYGFKLSFKHDQFYYLIFIILIVFEGLVTSRIYFNRSMLIAVAFFDSLLYANIFLSNKKSV
ncbi:MAG: hypothetical protein HKO67_11370 [Flavobacteriaceae bacterium]|nr:hypothetical protein [Flavobacteriaceae bacterium]